MKRIIIGLILIVSVLMTGCKEKEVDSNEPTDVVVEPESSAVVEMSILTSEVSEGIFNADVNVGIKEFSFDLYRRISEADKDENIFISPLSIMNALAMAMNGASETTYEEMKEVLYLDGLELEDINKGIASINYNIRTDENSKVSIANSLWVRESATLNNAYRESLKTYYDASSYQIDFTHPDAPDEVNGWISDNTNELIENIISRFNGDELIVLINAIYFNAEWRNQFNNTYTESDSFTSYNGEQLQINMMNQSFNWGLSYSEREEYTAVKLPYYNDEYFMQVILPNEGVDLYDVVQNMNATEFNELQRSYGTYNVNLGLPKFELEYGVRSLNKELMDMGMISAYSNASFTKMFDDHNATVSDVMHKAVIKVDEKGTEAAAVTVLVAVESMPPEYPKIDFKVNRPFLFIITDDENNIIFIGQKTC